MRLVQVTVPAGKREAVIETLDEEGIDYVLTEESSNREFDSLVSFPLPSNAVEPILEALREAGVDEQAYTVVLNAETVVSSRFEELTERFEEENNEDRIAREELQAKAKELSPGLSTFLVMTVVSVVIATAGLLMDSPAVVVGSMVIAPLIGPAMATSVGTVIDDDELFRRGVKLQIIGFSLAIVSAAAFAFLVRTIHLVPPGLAVLQLEEVSERVAPDFLSLVVALGAGVAGSLSLRSGVSASLVGVMIAVALVPPTAVIGIGLAWGLPLVVGGGLVLVTVNALSINLAALATFWYSGYRPSRWFMLGDAKAATIKRIAILVVFIVLLSSFLGLATYSSLQTAQFDREANGAVQTVLDQQQYESLHLLEVDVTFGNQIVLPNQPATVVVTIGQPAEKTYPSLASDIARQIRDVSDRPVTVQVRFQAVQEASQS